MAAVLALLMSGCGQNTSATRAGGSCFESVRWHATQYFLDARHLRAVGDILGGGDLPDCEGRPLERVMIRALRATPPGVAVGVEGRRGVWLAPGFPTESDRHPLHKLYFAVGRPRMTSQCRSAVVVRGRVTVIPARSSTLTVSSGGRGVRILIYARTAFLDLDHHGVPYLGFGQKVEIRGRRCSSITVAAQRILRR